MSVATDSEGRCIHHPFVQLQRLSHRTGEWKALLDSCPLCVMDDRSVASSACSSAIVPVVSDNDNDPPGASSSPSRRGRDRGRSTSIWPSEASVESTSSEAASPSLENALASLSHNPSSGGSHGRSRPRSTSRVRFGDDVSQNNNDRLLHTLLDNASVSSSSSLPAGSSNSNLLSGLSDDNGGNHIYRSSSSSSQSVSSATGTGTGEPLLSTKSALKTLPRYKACRVKMQRQLSESEKVTTMSMDMSMDFSIDDGENYDFGEDFGLEGHRRQYEGKDHRQIYEVDATTTHAAANEEVSIASIGNNSHRSEKSHGSDRSKEGRSHSERRSNNINGHQTRMDKKLQKISSRPQQQQQPSPPSEEDHRQKSSRRQTSRTNSGHTTDGDGRRHNGQEIKKNIIARDKKSNNDAKKKTTSKRPTTPRPDPEEFPCNASQGSHDRSSRHQHQQDQHHQQQRHRPQRTNDRVTSSFSSANQHYNNGQNPPPPSPLPPLPTQQQHSNNMDMSNLHLLQPTRQQPCYANMVVNPSPNYDDEVSTLSFMGNSVGSSHKATLGLPSLDDDDDQNNAAAASATTTPVNNTIQKRDVVNEVAQATNKALLAQQQQPLLLANSMIDTNDYDSKGRCVHHAHIRLRKKKLFGRGWKVLMSACPDCCVDELRRIRMVEQNNKKRIRKKLDRARNVGLGNNTNNEEGGLDSSHRSGVSRSSSHHSNQNMVQSVGSSGSGIGIHVQQQSPQRQQQQQQQQSSSFHSTGSSNSATPKSAAMAAPSLPPRHRSGFHITGSSNSTPATPKPSAMAVPPPSPNPPPPPPRPYKHSPSKETLLSRRSPSQESFQRRQQRHNVTPPPMGQLPPVIPSKRSPSQESFRDASVSLANAHHGTSIARRSPSQDSFRDAAASNNNIVNAKKDSTIRSSSSNNDDDLTASLTSDEQVSDSDRSSSRNANNGNNNTIPLIAQKLEHVNLSLHRNHQRVVPSSSSDGNSKTQDGTTQKKKKKKKEKKTKTKSSRSKSKERHKRKDASHKEPSQKQPQRPQEQQQQQQGTIHVRQMQWTDTKGLSGTYTGQVNDGFVPSGCGIMEYATGSVKEGEWKNGRYRKSIGGDKGRGHAGSGGGGDVGGGSRARSREGGRSRSRSRSRSTGRRQRSSSRSIRPQQAMPAAA